MVKVGQNAPDFQGLAIMPRPYAPDTIQSLSLAQLRGKYVILFFYPMDFTFVCPTEIIAFSDRQVEFNCVNTQIVAISCDSRFSHLAWTKRPREEGGLGELIVPLLSDSSKEISRAYDTLLPSGVPLRASIIIGPEGTIRQITMNDLPVGRNVDETIRLIKAFQYTDEYGEVCPAGWKPGDAAMVPSTVASKEYFQQSSTQNIFRDSDGTDGDGDGDRDRHNGDADAGEVTRVQFSNLPIASLPSLGSSSSSSSSSSSPLPTSSLTSYALSPFAQAFSKYQELLRNHPLPTKAVTSGVIALVGELIGAYIKRRSSIQRAPSSSASANRLSGEQPLVNWRRMGIFGVYGFAITGPMFHWWYGFLEKLVANQSLPPRNSIVLKILLDRLLLTPPFLLFSLGFIQYFQNFSATTAIANIRNSYAAALFTNWRVWTVAQGINFTYVPLEYRVLFGNLVALWWNIYLSLATAQTQTSNPR